MRQQSKEYIAILFVASVVALNYPFLDLFDTAWLPLGIPLLYLYIYLFWLLIIVLLIIIIGRSEIHEPDHPMPPSAEHPSQTRAIPTERSSDGNSERELRS